MAYQFAHLEIYSRRPRTALLTTGKDGKGKPKGKNKDRGKHSGKAPRKAAASTKFIFDEATRREPSACKHIENPRPPGHVFGMSIEELERLHDERCEQAFSKVGDKERKIRSDQNTLATVILSYPKQPDEGMAGYDEWEKRCVGWLQKLYGDELKTVIRHTDESHPHIHAYLLPKSRDMKAVRFHPGQNAQKEERERQIASGATKGVATKEAGRAYRESMRAWQSSFYADVGSPCGMTRKGPGLERLSHKESVERNRSAARLRAARVMEKRLDIREQKLRKDETFVAEQKRILAESEEPGFWKKRHRQKLIDRLLESDEAEKIRKQAFDEGAESKRKVFDEMQKVKNEQISNLKTENVSLRRSNVQISKSHAAMSREYSAAISRSQSFHNAAAQYEYVVSSGLFSLNETARRTNDRQDYAALSKQCEIVSTSHESNKNFFKLVIEDIKTICADVKERAPRFFHELFSGWNQEAAEMKQEFAEQKKAKIVQLTKKHHVSSRRLCQ